MQERERVIVSCLVVLLLVLAAGFVFHRDERFAGSLAGGILGISAAALMFVPLLYLFIKRIPFLKRRIVSHVSMRTLLAIHIYAGIVGPILAILHSSHKFNSTVGIALTLMMLIVVVSGFVGRYLMGRVLTDIREKQVTLTALQKQYDALASDLVVNPEAVVRIRRRSSVFGRLAAPFFVSSRGGGLSGESLDPVAKAVSLSESIADMEYAIRTQQAAKDAFGKWLACHIVIAIILYTLLVLHIWSEWYFGIRWLVPQ
ncbi:MAG: hypothetical protein IT430_01820 [Phycisphaerales bacterium]|nr:hypothetical protein [Phycisphaerales bacterium]